jgi:hypothetical protein
MVVVFMILRFMGATAMIVVVRHNKQNGSFRKAFGMRTALHPGDTKEFVSPRNSFATTERKYAMKFAPAHI